MEMNVSHLKRYLAASILVVTLLMVFLPGGKRTQALSLQPRCTPSWQYVDSSGPGEGGINNSLSAVAAFSPTQAWTVGRTYIYFNDFGYYPIDWKLNGSSWDDAGIPFGYGYSFYPGVFTAVADSSPNDVWVAGQQLVHWNGKSWRFFGNPGKVRISALAVLSPKNAWAVGSNVIQHWNGKSWSVVSNPGTGGLAGLTAISPNDIWAVGTDSSQNPETLHWNGSSWSVIPSPSTGSGGLVSVTAVSSNDVWTAGGSFIEHWDGSTWSIVPSPTPPGSSTLTSIAAGAANDIWAVGTFIDFNNILAEHWDGTQWTLAPIPSPNLDEEANFYAITHVPGTGEYWAVGNRGVIDGIDTLTELYTC
jgi:hypothetical protein